MFGLKKAPEIHRTPHVAELDDVVVSKPRKLYRNMVRMFKAGKNSRLNSKWPTTPLTADMVVERYQRSLVARSREQCSNNDYAKNYVRMVHQNIVGPQGVLMQAQITNGSGKLDNKAGNAIEVAWLNWGKKQYCDIRNKSTWREIQRTCVVFAAKDGEFFVRMIRGDVAGAWGFALQVIDAQRCPVDFNNNKMSGGRFIRQGIEFDQYGKLPPKKKPRTRPLPKAKQAYLEAEEKLHQELYEANIGYVRKYQFEPTKNWRFDFYIVKLGLLIEISGSAWAVGRGGRKVANSFCKFDVAEKTGHRYNPFDKKRVIHEKLIINCGINFSDT